MSRATIEQAEQEATEAGVTDASPPRASRSHRAAPLVAMAAGLVFLALAGMVLTGARDRGERMSPATDALPITLSARDISVVSQVYAPGEASGWHSHSGIHAVAVLSGTLTVYDGQCRPTTYQPGQPYVGGQELHLVRNEGEAPVVMAVTYLAPSTGNAPTRQLPAPPGCGQ